MQGLACLTLDVGKAVENLSVAHISLQVLQFVCVFEPAVADKLVDEGRKAGICLGNPTSVRDAVGNVGKLFGVHAIVIRKTSFLRISLCSALTPFMVCEVTRQRFAILTCPFERIALRLTTSQLLG